MRLAHDHVIATPMGGGLVTGTLTSTIMDAVGESTAFLGYLRLSTGRGTSKTLSAAGGGAIHWLSESTTTFANALSNLRIGIQGVGATGLEDGTYSVYGDMVPGTHSITANVLVETDMTTGTVTLAHGALIAIVIEWTARAGTDSVRPARFTGGTSPWCTTDTGTGPQKSGSTPLVAITFDDGTIGYFAPWSLPYRGTDQTFTPTSSPDEYAFIFTWPYDIEIDALVADCGEFDASETQVLGLYSDPLGTPVLMASAEAPTAANTGNVATTGRLILPLPQSVQLLANTLYAVSLRAVATGTREVRVRTTRAEYRALLWPEGCTFYGGTRTDDTGAFATSTTVIPVLGVNVTHITLPSAAAPRTRIVRGT